MIRFQTELPAVQARVREELNAEIGELYGLEFTRFEIRSVESDDYQQIVAEERAGTAEARRLARLGVDYATERRFGILDKAASNEGAGTLMGAGLGLGAGTLVWRAGMASWIPIATDPAFAPLFFPSK